MELMSAGTNLPHISTDRSIMSQQQQQAAAAAGMKGRQGSRPSFKRNSVQFKKKYRGPPLKNVHIRTLDNKLVCYTPTSPMYERRNTIYPEIHEPLVRKSNVQWSYKSHVGHPNLTQMPTRYSANKNRAPASGIVPMPPKWIDMTEQLKRDELKTVKRRKSRKSQDYHRQASVSFRDSIPQPPREMHIRNISISEVRKSLPNEPLPPVPKTPYPQGKHLPRLSEADQVLIKERRASRKPRNKMDPADRAELFIMHTPSTKWQSHWIGPM